MNCKYCGGELENDSKFCVKCGKSITEENLVGCVCTKCGEKLPIDSLFCIKCGTKVNEEILESKELNEQTFTKGKNRKIIGLCCLGIIAIIAVFWGIKRSQASGLKKELMRDWETIDGEDGVYITRILDFSDDEIEYKLETGYAWMDTTVATFDYKVVNGNTIKISRYGDEWETITIEFDDEKELMTVNPAITSVDEVEFWFNFD